MEINALIGKITAWIKKYRYAVLVLLVGLALMMLPNNTQKEEATENTEPVYIQKTSDINEQLADILSKIDGVGEARVLLTIEKGEEKIYQTDSDTSVSDDSRSSRVTTVIISNGNKEEEGLIRLINSPVYLGAIVVCQGGDDPTVRLSVVNAVSSVTGLGADCISVLKMK